MHLGKLKSAIQTLCSIGNYSIVRRKGRPFLLLGIALGVITGAVVALCWPRPIRYYPSLGPIVLTETDLVQYPYVVDLGLKVRSGTVLLFKLDNTYGAIVPRRQTGMVGTGTTWDIWHNPLGSGNILEVWREPIAALEVSMSEPAGQNVADWNWGDGHLYWYGWRSEVGVFCPNRRILLCPTDLTSVDDVKDASDPKWHYYAGRERYDLATTQNLSLDNPKGVLDLSEIEKTAIPTAARDAKR